MFVGRCEVLVGGCECLNLVLEVGDLGFQILNFFFHLIGFGSLDTHILEEG